MGLQKWDSRVGVWTDSWREVGKPSPGALANLPFYLLSFSDLWDLWEVWWHATTISKYQQQGVRLFIIVFFSIRVLWMSVPLSRIEVENLRVPKMHCASNPSLIPGQWFPTMIFRSQRGSFCSKSPFVVTKQTIAYSLSISASIIACLYIGR